MQENNGLKLPQMFKNTGIKKQLNIYYNFNHQVAISPIFYEQLFCTKVFCAALMCLQFGFVIFWQKDFGTKAAHKMLVKLTPDVTK